MTGITTVPSGADPAAVVEDEEAEMLTLLTCTGAFNGAEYEGRLVVRAIRV